ncbi:fatty acid desaturase family protein [Actinoplanes sp. NPDC051513]|uniref:fatty acid desaturase family protein n=1 Tax=Actinoplanes sp. NPDC051513 TaxID=3363908 RepID=UPI0037A32BE0
MTILETPRGSIYAELARQVKRAGLLHRRPGYYAARISLTVAAYAAAWAAVVLIGASWWVLAVAPLMAIAYTQLAFVGHDAGHRQIFRRRSANDLLGILIGDLGIGLSYGWWIDKHNRHHSHPNQEGKDPDVAAGALVFVKTHGTARTGIARLWVRSQAYLFFPLLLLEGPNLLVGSVRALAGRDVPARRRGLEIPLFVLHVGAYLTVLFLVLTPGQAVAFIAIHQGLFGLYMGCSFAPNHKGMPILDADDDTDFLRRQVLTSRNVNGGRFLDGVLGGLNYQIEHHLFPSMPRANLHRAQPIVRRFCEAHDVAYAQTSLIDSYRQALRHLDDVGRRSS